MKPSEGLSQVRGVRFVRVSVAAFRHVRFHAALRERLYTVRELSHTEWICVPTFSRLSTDSRSVSVGESLLVCWKRGSGANTGSDQNPRTSVTVDRSEKNQRNLV